MQTKNKLVAIGCGLLLLTTSSLSFANGSSTTSNKIVPTPSIVSQMTSASWSSKEVSFVWTFIKVKDILTEEEYKILSTMYANYHSQIKEVISNTKLSQEEKNVKILDINKTLFETLKPYIDSTKLEAYEKWVSERLSANNKKNDKKTWDIANVGKIVKDALNIGKNIVKKVKFQYKLLSEKTRQLVNIKIDSIPKEKREEYLKNLLVKIDKLIGVTKSASLKPKLEELKQVVQEKLDELSWISSDDSIIQDLLNDSSTDSSTSTTKQETNEIGK